MQPRLVMGVVQGMQLQQQLEVDAEHLAVQIKRTMGSFNLNIACITANDAKAVKLSLQTATVCALCKQDLQTALCVAVKCIVLGVVCCSARLQLMVGRW